MRKTQTLLAAVLLLLVPSLLAQPATSTHPTPMPMQHGQTPAGQMPPDCQAMMQKMEAMHASTKAMDDHLATLVGEMNKATGAAKVDRMAAVINELVTQRKQMRTDMETMMPQMMQHMSQHMQSGTAGMQSMAKCPMMSGAGESMHHPAATDHKKKG